MGRGAFNRMLLLLLFGLQIKWLLTLGAQKPAGGGYKWQLTVSEVSLIKFDDYKDALAFCILISREKMANREIEKELSSSLGLETAHPHNLFRARQFKTALIYFQLF